MTSPLRSIKRPNPQLKSNSIFDRLGSKALNESYEPLTITTNVCQDKQVKRMKTGKVEINYDFAPTLNRPELSILMMDNSKK